MFNYTQSETGRRAWIILNSGSYTDITFSKVDSETDTYDLVVWGVKIDTKLIYSAMSLLQNTLLQL